MSFLIYLNRNIFEVKLYHYMCYRFIQYNPTSLERNYKYEVLTEHDLGVTIDLINRETYASDYSAQLDPADEKLLEEDVLTPQDSKRLNVWPSITTSWKSRENLQIPNTSAGFRNRHLNLMLHCYIVHHVSKLVLQLLCTLNNHIYHN